jgi:hypothetical protein
MNKPPTVKVPRTLLWELLKLGYAQQAYLRRSAIYNSEVNDPDAAHQYDIMALDATITVNGTAELLGVIDHS